MNKSRIFLMGIIALAFVLVSCYSEDPTIAEVRVVTVNDSPVGGAEVRLFGRGTEGDAEAGNIRFDKTSFTGSNGIASFDFTPDFKSGQSGFAILDVEITAAFPDSTVFIEGIIRLQPEETTRRTFRIE